MSNNLAKCLHLKSDKQIYYASEHTVCELIKHRGFSNTAGLAGTNTSDLSSGIYEGGLKIWEGSVDLCNYIDANLGSLLGGKLVLEIGCGAALPSILSLLHGAAFVVVNDFNDFVLECFCRENFHLNGISDDKWRSVTGSWNSLMQGREDDPSDLKPKSFDLILTSETIYNLEYYEDLHSVLDRFLSDDGQVLLAAKVYYFGLDASIIDFKEFVSGKGVFNCTDVWTSSEEGVPRKILQLTRRQ